MLLHSTACTSLRRERERSHDGRAAPTCGVCQHARTNLPFAQAVQAGLRPASQPTPAPPAESNCLPLRLLPPRQAWPAPAAPAAARLLRRRAGRLTAPLDSGSAAWLPALRPGSPASVAAGQAAAQARVVTWQGAAQRLPIKIPPFHTATGPATPETATHPPPRHCRSALPQLSHALQLGPTQHAPTAHLQSFRRSLYARPQLPHELQLVAFSAVELQAADLRGHSVQQAAPRLQLLWRQRGGC